MRAIVALGSNLGDRRAILEQAALRLASLAEGGKLRASHLYETRPWGVIDQPDFLNAVVRFETRLGPPALLAALKAIERDAGRTEGTRWGPRILDLDILDMDGILREGDPTLPHPRIAERAFVLVPLCEIDPEWAHPLTGRTAVGMLRDLDPDPAEIRPAGRLRIPEGEGEHGRGSRLPGN